MLLIKEYYFVESWSFLRKLGAAQTSWKYCKVSQHSVKSILHKSSNIKPKKHEKIKVKAKYMEEQNRCTEKSEMMKNVGIKKVEVSLKLIKNGKGAGVLLELLKHLGIKSKLWLAKIFSSVKKIAT